VPEGVTGTIMVECSPWLEDNQWVLDLAAQDPFIVGLVGHLEPDAPDIASQVDRFAADPVFRGIRARLDPSEDHGLATAAMLIEKDLQLDTGMYESVPALAARFPELRIVINHCGGIPIDGKTPNPGKLDLMRKAAAHPQVFCKVSGMMDLRSTVKPAPTELDFYVPLLDALWDLFGEDRLIYGSDWPVSDRSGHDYAQIQRLVTEYFSSRGESAMEKYFWRNAKAAYKWIDR
jgi:L-fuconolactonase